MHQRYYYTNAYSYPFFLIIDIYHKAKVDIFHLSSILHFSYSILNQNTYWYKQINKLLTVGYSYIKQNIKLEIFIKSAF